jgi:mono/diheme cytochrome c family protein
MISAFMPRPVKVLVILSASIAVAALATACGTQKISVPSSDRTDHHGSVLFSQRCSGCHTLSYAATHGSAANPRTAQFNNGPNFDVRCERPIARVLYAIENGGFSGAVMPQNIVLGQDAMDVAEFVAKYSGGHAPRVSGLPSCTSQPIGTIPATTSTTPTATIASSPTTTSTAAPAAPGKTGAGSKKKKK